MESFQKAPLQACLQQGRLLIGTSASPSYSQIPTSSYSKRAISSTMKGHCITVQSRRKAIVNHLLWCPKRADVGSSRGQIGGKKLVQTRNAAFRRDRTSSVTISATARPIDIDDDATVECVPVQTENLVEAGVDWLDAFHRFSRPHTMIGSALGVISVSLLAVQNPADISWTFFRGLFQAVLPALLMNIYIVGLNQLYDIDIDKVNKPYLPLASGEFSVATGVAIITTCALMSLAIGVTVGSRPLLWALSVSLVLGTAYSADVPFLRWKRSAIAAAMCILSVRAIVVQLGFYFHMQGFVFGRNPVMTKALLFATAFMSFFSVVIALAKDIPDVEGDRVYGIRSFSVRVGQKRVFWLCVWLIQIAYGVAMSVGLSFPTWWGRLSMILGHSALATLLWVKAKATNLKSKTDIVSFYMFIWKLFYAEYLIIPFVR